MARRPSIALACLEPDSEAAADYLERRGFDVHQAEEEWELRSLLRQTPLDVVVIGETMPQATDAEHLAQDAADTDTSIILMRPRGSGGHRARAGAGRRRRRQRSDGCAGAGGTHFRPADAPRRGGAGPDRARKFDRRPQARRWSCIFGGGGATFARPGGAAQAFRGKPEQGADPGRHHGGRAGRKHDAFDRSINSRIVRLRRKLDTDNIVTIRGTGYRFDPPDIG